MKIAYTDSIYEVAEFMLGGNDIVVVEDLDLPEYNDDTGEEETRFWCKIFVKTVELTDQIISKTNWEPNKGSPAPHLYAATSFSVGGTAEEIALQLGHTKTA